MSGGQTGVDRAALDVALDLGMECGGWVPAGRRAEDGAVPGCYPVRELDSTGYAERTEANVADSDATLVLTVGEPTGGTALTVETAVALGRPHLIVDLDRPDLDHAAAFLASHRPGTLNVAGPRESQRPGIGTRAREVLAVLLGRYT